MPVLTLCIPSKRNHQAALPSIASALAFAEARDALVIVTDNSGDAEKLSYWQNHHPRLQIIKTEAKNAYANMLEAAKAASTDFILMIGDDDFVCIEADHTPYDLEDLPFDYVGVLPVMEIFHPQTKRCEEFRFALEQQTGAERMKAYRMSVRLNIGFYAIYRRSIWLSIFDLFVRFHPTQAGFCDWSLAFALITSGKLVFDPSWRFRYNGEGWESSDDIMESAKKLHHNAGFPEHSLYYEHLLAVLDCFVLINRIGSPNSIDERQDLGQFIVNALFQNFIYEVAQKPHIYPPTVLQMIDMLKSETDSFARFQIAIIMVDHAFPGMNLKQKYINFFQASLHGW